MSGPQMSSSAEERNATAEPAWVRRTLIAVALLFLALLVRVTRRLPAR